MTSPDNFEQKLNVLKFKWKNAKDQYKAAYPNYKLNIDREPRNRAYQAAVGTYRDIKVLEATMKGTVASTNTHLNSKDKEIKSVKNEYDTNKVKLQSTYGNNVASKPLKKDKFNEYSESLVFLSFYSIAFFTSTFFIYKQLKQ